MAQKSVWKSRLPWSLLWQKLLIVKSHRLPTTPSSTRDFAIGALAIICHIDRELEKEKSLSLTLSVSVSAIPKRCSTATLRNVMQYKIERKKSAYCNSIPQWNGFVLLLTSSLKTKTGVRWIVFGIWCEVLWLNGNFTITSFPRNRCICMSLSLLSRYFWTPKLVKMEISQNREAKNEWMNRWMQQI